MSKEIKKTKEYYESLDKRSKEYKQYKASLIMDKPSEGLGDSIEKITQATGIKTIVKSIWGDDCGCAERKEKLNKLFKYKKIECLEEHEFQYLKDLFSRLKSRIEPVDQQNVLKIYNRVFNTELKPTQCTTCWIEIIKKMRNIYNEHTN